MRKNKRYVGVMVDTTKVVNMSTEMGRKLVSLSNIPITVLPNRKSFK